jgi:hypothetical protein
VPKRKFDLTAGIMIATLLLVGCGDSAGPNQGGKPVILPEPGTSGPEFLAMTRDGKPWEFETSGMYMIGPTASFGWDRYVAGTPMREGMGLFLHKFTGVGDYPLSDYTTDSQGFYGVIDTSTHFGTTFGTTKAHPGRARISGFDPADSTISGNFSFEVLFPGGAKTSFTGSFRIRHPICCPAPTNRPTHRLPDQQ